MNLFDQLREQEFQEAAREAVSRPSPLKPQIITPDADDPFFDPSDGEWQEMLLAKEPEKGGYGKVTGIKGTGSPFKAREHYPRIIKRLETLHGGMFWPCDRKIITHSGMVLDQDLLGFQDIQGISEGQFIAANVTTKESMKAHMRDYTNPNNTYGQGKKRVLDLLRAFLAHKGIFYIAGSFRPEGQRIWQYEMMQVSETMLDEYIARKRGAKR